MRVYNLFSDPHLGTKRAAHTTADSARRLKDRLYTNALVASEPLNSLCLGDLFDKAHNDEATLVQGYTIASRCEMVMAGNHDLSNREGVITSLDAVQHMMDDRNNASTCRHIEVVMAPDLSTPHFSVWNQFWVVPHHASQEVFEEAMSQAADSSGPIDNPNRGHRYLLLHCNYDCPFETEDSTLNLSPEMAEELLQSFTRIFIGHEHNSKMFHDSRVVLVGNTHPTSFSDISDKYRWELDTTTDELNPVIIWDKSYAYREIKYGNPVPDLTGVQFVDVVGAEPADSSVDVADYVRSVWNAGKSLIAVRNNVEITDHLAGAEGVDSSAPALVNLSQRIHDDLAGSDLQDYYQSLVKRADSL